MEKGRALNVSINYRPRKFFVDFHARRTRFAVIVAHRRCGKTEACLGEMVIRALSTKKPYARYAYIAPFKGQGVSVAWDRLQRIIGNDLIKLCTVSKSEKSISLPNGAKLFIIGADNYDALRGNYFDGVILDEVGDMHPEAWTLVILPALAEREGWAVFIGTPKGKNFFWKQYEKARFNEDGNWFCLCLPLSLTRLLSQAEIDLQKDQLDEDEYNQEYECSFDAALKGAYWSKQLIAAKEEGRMGPIQHNKIMPVHTAWDLGYSDSTAIWFFQVVNGQWDVLHYFEGAGLAIFEIWAEIQTICRTYGYKLGTCWLPHDAGHHSLQTGKTMFQQLHALGAKVKRVPDEGLQTGIQAVRASIPKMRIDDSREHCYDAVEALKAYTKKWSEKLGTFSNQPVHDAASHPADAFRYMCLAVRDQDIAASALIQAAPITSVQAFDQWQAQTSINTASTNRPTLDELFAMQPSRRYERI